MSKKLISIFSLPMYGNGLDRVILNLTNGLTDLGFQIDLIVPEVTKYHQSILNDFSPEVRTVSLDILFHKLIFIEKIFKLKQYLDQNKPSVLLVNGDYVGVTNIAKFLSSSSTKIVHAVHIHVSQYFQAVGGFRKHLRFWLLKHFYRSSDGIVAVSKGVANNISSITGIPYTEIKVIYNPVVTSDLLEKSEAKIQHSWFQYNQIPIILGAGRLMEQKDFSTLIKAFAKLRSQRLCRLVIIGEPTAHKAELEALAHELGIEDDVQFPGHTSNPYAFMSKASVFVMSSRYEGFGNVLVEAMAVGTPVVSTNCESGPSEILEDGHYGLLVPVNDVEAMADAINQTLDHPINSKILQERAQFFSIEKVSKQYAEYLTLINH